VSFHNSCDRLPELLSSVGIYIAPDDDELKFLYSFTLLYYHKPALTRVIYTRTSIYLRFVNSITLSAENCGSSSEKKIK